MFKGARVQGGDYFDDVFRGNDKAGVFEGIGVDDYENVKETVDQDGLQVRMNCRVCNQAANVTLEWMELYIVGSNGQGLSLLVPTGWAYSPNNASLYPANIPCGKCRAPLCPQITPDEARSRVNDALGRGLIDQAQVRQWQAACAGYRQQQGG